ncbi:MAG: RNA 2'-phosphotransferase [Mycobacteriales bacterium]
MQPARLVEISKYLAKHLRHDPERIGLSLDEGGWVEVDQLLRACSAHGFRLTRGELDEVVRRNDKRRYAYDVTGRRIRASQGHSLPVDLGLSPTAPPPVLFHGTAAAALPGILAAGLRPMRRISVHLSPDVATARRVGGRHGPPVVLAVDAAAMARLGHAFTVSENGVWLVDAVPPARLRPLDGWGQRLPAGRRRGQPGGSGGQRRTSSATRSVAARTAAGPPPAAPAARPTR